MVSNYKEGSLVTVFKTKILDNLLEGKIYRLLVNLKYEEGGGGF